MKRYQLSLEVKLIEIPEPEPEPEFPAVGVAEDFPKAAFGALSTMVGTLNSPVLRIPAMPAGFDYRKTVAISCGDFQGAADVVSQFDRLVSQLALERP